MDAAAGQTRRLVFIVPRPVECTSPVDDGPRIACANATYNTLHRSEIEKVFALEALVEVEVDGHPASVRKEMCGFDNHEHDALLGLELEGG
jgi:hypothetical protein